MSYTEQTLIAEHLALWSGEDRGDVIAWLTSPRMGLIETEEDWNE